MNSIYTRSERSVKKYKISDAIASARRQLGNIPMCTDAVIHRSMDDPITLSELNDIAERLVDDTKYYGEFL